MRRQVPHGEAADPAKVGLDQEVAITGYVRSADAGGGDGVLRYIDQENREIVSGKLSNCGRQSLQDGRGGERLNSLRVNRGESIYFIVDPGANTDWDSTLLNINLEKVSVYPR